ncbi:hypothetical protein SADUNF_Sadunf15G0013300 [Salix dunnii]|uniref:B3 domain-containing protein n=1 Tax=Salix dunnii TaxID=1413687 RepID=A0A835JHN7_9ROSI|nr:hypothetical protein SADUNF_Sadunf15G0013300 [Salix dunnii]
MKNIDPSTSRVEEDKKESEEKGVLLVTERDFKGENIDTDVKITDFDALVAVCCIAYKNLKQEKGDEKQKGDAILGDGKICRLVRERAFKKPADYFELKTKERFVREKLPNSAIKSCEICNGEGMEFERNLPRKRASASVEWPSCSTESCRRNGFIHGIMTGVSDDELEKNLYLRKDSAFERSNAQCKSDSGLKKEEKPSCVLDPLADLPPKVRERIVSMEGKDVELVVEKQLYQTDMNDTNSRLSIPIRQVIAKNFLKDEEKRALVDGDCLKVKILEPSLDMVSDMNLKQWNMFKEKGSVSSSYVFITHWNSLRRRNHLCLFDRIQVWSFRVENDLYFALVKVGEGEEPRNCSTGSNTGAATSSQAGVAGYGSNGSASNASGTNSESRRENQVVPVNMELGAVQVHVQEKE